eukprot:1841938-Amphidinium_carterae.1
MAHRDIAQSSASTSTATMDRDDDAGHVARRFAGLWAWHGVWGAWTFARASTDLQDREAKCALAYSPNKKDNIT